MSIHIDFLVRENIPDPVTSDENEVPVGGDGGLFHVRLCRHNLLVLSTEHQQLGNVSFLKVFVVLKAIMKAKKQEYKNN